MADGAARESKIVATYRARTRRAAELYRRAREVLPGGIVHESRRMWPYGVYGDRALGSRKWDVDGNEYVDYYGGHGSLLLGHQHPAVLEAIERQLRKGMHLAAAHELEIEWARLIVEIVPSAERVRFTSSGTEATQLAMRIARAHTGKRRVVRFATHFHGWHDQVAGGVHDHFDGSANAGVLKEVAENTTLVLPNDVAAVEQVIANRNDVAAVMLEPIGSSSGIVPTPPEVLGALREITRKHSVLLIFDEVVTGFRVAPGGAQEFYGVIPDLTTMAKIVAGGMPGGAVGGAADMIDWLDYEAAHASGREHINHHGTHNAHPVSAAAGIATLEIVRDTNACEKASAIAARLRNGMNEVLEEEGVAWAVYGEHSFFHIHSNPRGDTIRPTKFDASTITPEMLKGRDESMLAKLRLAMLNNGVDLKGWRGGILSAAHTQADVEVTLDAWRKSLRALKEEGAVRPTV
ncbi:MAG TPA: aminotransferase class III-fold pyridoxal phosphate-dependent enzyme [Burkholderiales bacterium]|nr:aminotransferase class III-fold pyridoxal phosphate-dependent enzyme [Burkholderiales bacterium]